MQRAPSGTLRALACHRGAMRAPRADMCPLRASRTRAHLACGWGGKQKMGGFLGSQKSLAGAEGGKTLGGLNPKLAHIDSTMRGVKLGESAFAGEAPDPIDLADAGNAQYAVPYIKDIMRVLRETEVWRTAQAPAPMRTMGVCSAAQRCAVVTRAALARRPWLLCAVQSKYLAPPTYMAQQADVNEKMRAILIDWLIEVHLKFKLVPETMYVTVNLIDRFLSKKSIQRNKLQLVGVTAMFIASKYEEIYAPEVRDFVYISDKAYSREEILKMEANMLGMLNFNVTAPSAFAFLKRFVKVAGFLHHDEGREERLCTYLVELTLQEYRMLKYLPSVIAASAVCLAQKMLRQGSWVRAARCPHRESSRRGRPSTRLTRALCTTRARLFRAVVSHADAHVLSGGDAAAMHEGHERDREGGAEEQPLRCAQEVLAGQVRGGRARADGRALTMKLCA